MGARTGSSMEKTGVVFHQLFVLCLSGTDTSTLTDDSIASRALSRRRLRRMQGLASTYLGKIPVSHESPVQSFMSYQVHSQVGTSQIIRSARKWWPKTMRVAGHTLHDHDARTVNAPEKRK